MCISARLSLYYCFTKRPSVVKDGGQNRLFIMYGWISTNISVFCSYVGLIYHVSTNLYTPSQPESNYPSGKIFFSPISSPPCSAFSFRFCVTSQLYTLAVATSSVCSINLSQQSEHAVEPQNADNHRDLFPQKIQVFLTRLQAVLRNTKLRLEQDHGLCNRV